MYGNKYSLSYHITVISEKTSIFPHSERLKLGKAKMSPSVNCLGSNASSQLFFIILATSPE